MIRALRLRSAIFAFALLAAVSCTKKETAPGAAHVIRIGEVGSLTGAEATFGTSTHDGIRLAIDQANAQGGVRGKKLELVTVDDQGNPSEATLGITKLITQDKVTAVLGEVASGRSIAMAPIAQQYQVPMISPSSINSKLTPIGNFIFRVCFVDKFQSRAMADFAVKNLKAKTAAILRDSKSDYSVDSSNIFSELFQKAGGRIVADQSYSSGDIDFKSQFTDIRAKNPDVIVVPGYYTDIGLMAKQKAQLGIQAPMLGGDGWDSPKLSEIGGSSLAGSYFVSHFSAEDKDPLVQDFVSKYRATHQGVIPDGLAALGYDAARLLIDALARAKSGSSADLRDAIASTRDFAGITGKITIGPDRNAIKPAVVFKIAQDGAFKQEAKLAP